MTPGRMWCAGLLCCGSLLHSPHFPLQLAAATEREKEAAAQLQQLQAEREHEAHLVGGLLWTHCRLFPFGCPALRACACAHSGCHPCLIPRLNLRVSPAQHADMVSKLEEEKGALQSKVRKALGVWRRAGL